MSDRSHAHLEAFLEMMSAERGSAENTLSSYERDLDDLSSFLSEKKTSLLKADSNDLGAYIAHLAKQGFAASSQARRLSAIRQFYKFLFAENIRGDDPSSILDAPKKPQSIPKILSEADVNRLLERAQAEASEEGPEGCLDFGCWRFWNFSMPRACA